jgi:hypothetical protein
VNHSTFCPDNFSPFVVLHMKLGKGSDDADEVLAPSVDGFSLA